MYEIENKTQHELLAYYIRLQHILLSLFFFLQLSLYAEMLGFGVRSLCDFIVVACVSTYIFLYSFFVCHLYKIVSIAFLFKI